MKNILNIFAFLVLALVATSCLDDELTLDPKNSINVIEFKNPALFASPSGSTYSLYAAAFDFADEVDYPVTVSYSGANVAPQDIKIDLAINQAAITQYNEEQGAHFDLLPPDLYTIPTQVTILKGQRTAVVDLKIKSSKLPFDKSYVLPLQIVSASSGVISGNFETILINVIPKNPYDGVYTYTTSANTSLVPNATKTLTLVTLNGTTVKLLPGLLGTYSNEVTYTVDPETNQVTVTCPSLGVQTPQDTRSKWDPVNKVMTVFWKQGNGGRTFEEVFTYKGSR
ncbi:protein of unknown function [Spirosomataceae bacterium TFI 002]|nr:protein of unknown function [Spirosomataceae bacterium TFI 002]